MQKIKKISINREILNKKVNDDLDDKISEYAFKKGICYLKAKDIILSTNLLKFV